MMKKITDEDVLSIFKIAANLDMTQKEIAEAFQISQGHVSRILAKRRRLVKAAV